MKQGTYQRINQTLRVHVQYEYLTLTELSNLIRAYESALLSLWQSETRRFSSVIQVPRAKLVVNEIHTGNSIDLLTQYAIPALYFTTAIAGPVYDWPGVVGHSFSRLCALLRGYSNIPEMAGYVEIEGGTSPYARIPLAALADERITRRVMRLLREIKSTNVNAEFTSDGVDERIKIVSRR